MVVLKLLTTSQCVRDRCDWKLVTAAGTVNGLRDFVAVLEWTIMRMYFFAPAEENTDSVQLVPGKHAHK